MITRIAVVVPAANEEALIGACLDSVTAAAAAVPCPVRIVVVLDACTDDTAARIGRFDGVGTVVSSAGNVGEARRLGTVHALGEDDPRELWLANTDADCRVPRHWLATMLRHTADADLVLGTVLPDGGLTSAVADTWFGQHSQRDGHPHVHGANLGISAGAYLALGGWAPLPSGEDVDLTERAAHARLRVRRTADIGVHTSTRPVGRTPHGFSSYLRAIGHA